MKGNILVSGCLLGEFVRYDGGTQKLNHRIFLKWVNEGRVVSVCPEVLGGLSVPRDPAEIIGERILSEYGKDVTEAFQKGAEITLRIAQKAGVRVALLKERSPSCGHQHIYDGSFSGALVAGQGWTVRLLETHGIRVFGESEIEDASAFLEELELS